MGQRERRRFERYRQRIVCELHHGGRTQAGVVLDVSARGLFVRTSTGTAPSDGSEIRVVVKTDPPFDLLARLARAHVVRRELVSAADGGFGLEVVSAPEAFYQLVRAVESGR